MTWQKWGSKQSLEKRKTRFYELLNASILRGILFAEKLTNAIQSVTIVTN
jgi:hypothetical protein